MRTEASQIDLHSVDPQPFVFGDMLGTHLVDNLDDLSLYRMGKILPKLKRQLFFGAAEIEAQTVDEMHGFLCLPAFIFTDPTGAKCIQYIDERIDFLVGRHFSLRHFLQPIAIRFFESLHFLDAHHTMRVWTWAGDSLWIVFSTRFLNVGSRKRFGQQGNTAVVLKE